MSENVSQESAPKSGSGAMFDAIAHRYDLLNRILSLGNDQRWRRLLVDALAVGPEGGEVLDLATGTADVAIQIAQRHPKCRVVGVDPSARMLDIGRAKVNTLQLGDRITLEQGTAEQLPFESGRFDGVCIAFGIRNVPDRERALAEMARVCKPNGRVAILELSEPGPGFFGACARVHVHHVVPWVGSLLSGAKEYRYLQKSIAAFPPATEFAQMMERSGLRVVELVSFIFGVAHLYVATPQIGSSTS